MVPKVGERLRRPILPIKKKVNRKVPLILRLLERGVPHPRTVERVGNRLQRK
jgi:hypothetical protein